MESKSLFEYLFLIVFLCRYNPVFQFTVQGETIVSLRPA